MNETGLTSAEAARLAKEGKANRVDDKSDKGVVGIILSNLLTYFNLIFAVLAALLVATGSVKNLTFLPVVVANALIGIVQQLRSKKVLDELALLDVSAYTAIRDGADVELPSDKLVLGDLVRLESGQQIPADAEVVSGTASVNESLLTGEADEIEKVPGSELRSGSFLTAGSVVARLTAVGADSYAAKLTAEAKATKEKPSEMVADIERIVRVAGVLIIPIGCGLLYQAIYENGSTLAEAVTSMVGAVTGMIPEGLYLLVTIALALSAMRLAQKKVLLHDMRSIEALARVDVLCVDKTGTITSEDMSVAETFGAAGVSDGDTEAARQVLASYAHTVPDANITMVALREHVGEAEPLAATEVMPFNSKTKYSEVRLAGEAWRLGAPEFLLSPAQLEANRTLVEARTGEGLRVLALVREQGGTTEPALFVALRNEIRENAPETFSFFAERGVEVKVISGDNPLTVSKVAQQASIANAERYVDATTLDTPEKIREAATAYTVFGRVKPEQKKALVLALKDAGLSVAMTGDGVNDILAMKEADCSIAMGGGSDAARQAAQVVLLDSDFSRMRDIVGEGRRDINNITRSATLFLYKNIFSLLLAAFSLWHGFTYPLTPTQVSLVSMFNIGIPAFLLALEPNERRQEGRFIRNTLLGALPAALTSFFAIAAMVGFTELFGIDSAEVGTASTYLLSVVGFMILWNIAQPPTAFHLGVLGLCMAGFVAGGWFLDGLFDIRDISWRATALCVVFALAEMGVMDRLDFVVRKLVSRRQAPGRTDA